MEWIFIHIENFRKLISKFNWVSSDFGCFYDFLAEFTNEVTFCIEFMDSSHCHGESQKDYD